MSQNNLDKLDELQARLVVFSHALDSLHSTYEFSDEFQTVILSIATELGEIVDQLKGFKTA